MDPLQLALMSGTVLGNYFQSKSQQNAASESLAAQMAMARDNLKFAKSARTDAYGNRVYYDDTTGEWKTDLDPFQNRIIKAGEHEQYAGLTHDAAQNRAVRDREFQRGDQAAEDYNRTNAEYKYGYSPSEGATQAELTKLAALAQPTTSPAYNNIRTRGNLPIIQSNTTTNYTDPVAKLAQIIAASRSGAIQETGARASARNSKYLPALQQYSQVAQGGGGAPINFSKTPDEINKTQQDIAKLGETAYANNAKNIGTANNVLTTAQGKGATDLSKFLPKAQGQKAANSDDPNSFFANQGYYGGSPETNQYLNPSTYDYA